MGQMILITNTNMGKRSGNATLLERRAEAMFAVKGIFTRILVYRGVRQERKPVRTDSYSVDYADAFSGIKKEILSIRPEYIVLYGRRVSILTFRLRRFLKKEQLDCKILLDIQACVEEKWEFAEGLKQKLKYPLHSLVFRLTLNDVDGAFVVSDELIENCEQKRMRKGKPFVFYKVRCGINALYTPQEKQVYRRSVRQQYGISDDTVVFVFGGFRLPWQKIDETIAQMQCYDLALEKAHFMFFCDSDPEFEQQLAKAFPKGNYTVKLIDKAAYLQTLCACDVGYLLRDYKETNRVAFPNKFSEYLSCGLLIAINGSLPEPLRILKKHDIPYLNPDNAALQQNLDQIHWYQNHLEQYYEKAVQACLQELMYDAQIRQTDL